MGEGCHGGPSWGELGPSPSFLGKENTNTTGVRWSKGRQERGSKAVFGIARIASSWLVKALGRATAVTLAGPASEEMCVGQ